MGIEVDMYDPFIDKHELDMKTSCYFIGTNHDVFLDYEFPKDSIVLDPWGIIQDQDGVTVIRIGR